MKYEVLQSFFRGLATPSVAIIIGLAVAVIVGAALLRSLIQDRRPRYVRTARLLTDNEADFARRLREICPKDLFICPQVAISALVGVAEHFTDRRAARNSYSQCFADFVLCRADTFEVVGIIEVDDRTHGLAHRKARDERLDAIYKVIGLPVTHVVAKKTGRYSARDAELAIEEIWRQQKAGGIG
jgi:hypothetical protein